MPTAPIFDALADRAFYSTPVLPKPVKAPAADYSRVFNYITDPSAENAKAADVREFFRQLFKDQFSCEANAENADGYVCGRMVVELKGHHDDWLPGFYQALHYAKKGLGFAHITVLANNFIGLWRVNKIPDFAKRLANATPPLLAASAAGLENASILASAFAGQPPTDAATQLVEAVRAVCGHWATAVCGGQTLTDVGLKTEAYFKYFAAPDFLTRHAGLVQIRAYAAKHPGASWYPELQKRLTRLAGLREAVKGEIHRLLTQELRYFA